MPGFKFDYPPLLAPGRHYLTLPEVYGLCVTPFDGDALSCREKLYYAMEQLIQSLLTARICCEVIVDGSFLTAKPMPEDVDVKVYIDVNAYDLLDDQQLFVYNSVNEDGYTVGVDKSAWVTYPRGHPDFGSALDLGNSSEDYGLEHSGIWLKGYVVLRLWETDVGIRIRR